MRNPRLGWTCLLLGLLSAGCGGSNMLKLKGRIVKGGQPYIVAADESMRIVFVPSAAAPDKYDSYFATYDRNDGTFRVTGKDGNGLPPGKYKVSLELMKQRNDQFKGAYSASKSPFAFEVTASTGEVLIDLDKKG